MGKIYKGSTEIGPGKLLVGSTPVKQVYLGSTKIWDADATDYFLVTSSELSTGFDTTTTKTINNVPIGNPLASRRVIVLFQTQGAGGHTVDFVTIGGVNATLVTTLNGNTTCTIAFATVPTGTTATVVIFHSAAGSSAVGGLIAGRIYPSSGALGISASTNNRLTTGVATVTSLANKLVLYATAAQGLSPASSMNMNLVNGIQTFYNPVDVGGVWVAGIQPVNATAGSKTFTPNWTPDAPNSTSETGTVAVAFT